MNYFDFGLQRSGTNFIETIINRNFNGKRQNRANASWKHFIDPPKQWTAQHPTFLIYKNPYTWVESICFRNTVDWIKTQKTYPVTEGQPDLVAGPKNINVEALAKTYRHWHDKWILNPKPKANYENVYVIKYEDLLEVETRNKILDDISQKFNVKRKHSSWAIPNKGAVSQSKDYTDDREKYYLEMKPQKLLPRHIRAINNILTKDLISQIGYDVL